MSENVKKNHLANETSPYLQQHMHNPVDWYPWGDEALKRAKREQRPIFLSIGYSACHWCHVMERESFENEAVGEFLNKHFISIKVDREERPDLDHIYMNAVQVLTQHGGWPMSVFLTPELEPFYGGTYFPPEDRSGMPSFTRVITSVATAWQTKKEDVRKSARQLVQALESFDTVPPGEGKVSPQHIDHAVEALVRNFDSNFGGFGGAPKFFHTMGLRLCLRAHHRSQNETALKVATYSLKKMAAGGIYDQIGGGFHRYSVDAAWHVPHFEKMLYDNALLVETYLEAYQMTKDFSFATTARHTLDFLLREMRSDAGGFFSTQDADSEGVEGKFYVWTPKTVAAALSPDVAELFCRAFDVTADGNWEHGNSILRKTESDEELASRLGMNVDEMKEPLLVAAKRLLKARSERVPPLTDTKVLLSWNGMTIHALAMGYQVLGEKAYLDAAVKAADFIVRTLESPARTPEGTPLMFRVFKDGKSRLTAYLDDYAHWINALITLYESDFQKKWLERAENYARTLLSEFWDTEQGGFFYTGNSHETLFMRPRENNDGATPSGTAMAVTVLLRLHALTGRAEWLAPAKTTLEKSEALLRMAPTASTQMLLALDGYLNGTSEIAVIAGKDADEFEDALHLLRARYLGARVVAAIPPGENATSEPALLKDKKPLDNQTTTFVCRSFRCEKPLQGIEELKSYLK